MCDVAGLHLWKSAAWAPKSGEVAGAGDCVERRVARADGYAAAEFPSRGGDAVFLMRGEPWPTASDGLIDLTSYWRIDSVVSVGASSNGTIWAARSGS